MIVTSLWLFYFAIIYCLNVLKCDYGNEVQTGKGIRRAIDEGIVKREDLYITTKLWNTYHAEDHVPIALDKCLKDLGLDYVDEFLIHFPISMEYVPIEKKYPPEWTVSPLMILCFYPVSHLEWVSKLVYTFVK